MSVRSNILPDQASLRGRDGELLSIKVRTEPRRLERVLEALASLPFPINPQIYHQGGIAYIYGDGREERKHLTIVEFPAFSDQLELVKKALQRAGLPPETAHVRPMLENIHTDHCTEAAPSGAPYARVMFYKHPPA